jgi:hypothetical protein
VLAVLVRRACFHPLTLALLRELAWVVTTPGHRHVVAAQLARLRATAAAQDFDVTTMRRLERRAGLVEDALTGTWTAPGPDDG